MIATALILFATLFTDAAQAGEFTTRDPVQAFVQGEYPLGDDYFINGNKDTRILRCALTREKNQTDGIALSEISIWGNRTGPWEIFNKQQDGSYSYAGTRHLPDTACMENCSTREYLTSGKCTWNKGWPK